MPLDDRDRVRRPVITGEHTLRSTSAKSQADLRLGLWRDILIAPHELSKYSGSLGTVSKYLLEREVVSSTALAVI